MILGNPGVIIRGKTPVFHFVLLKLKELSYGNLSAKNRLGVFRKPGNEVLVPGRSQIGRLSLIWLYT